MSGVNEIFSTNLRDGETLAKINSWLGRFRGDELLRFHAERISKDTTKLLLECFDHKRLRIVASSPPHQSYLQVDKTVPYVDILFSEPIDLASFQSSNVTFDGTAVADGKLSTMNDGYVLRVNLDAFTPAANGMHELIISENVRHANKLWKLYGERKVIWTTSTHGGSRGGVDIQDPEKSRLQISRVIAEGEHSEAKMFREFYNQTGVDPFDVIDSQFTSGYPEFDRTILYVIHKKVTKIPYVKCVNPEYKSCFYGESGSPVEYNIEIGFSEPIDEDYIDGDIYVDDVAITGGDLTISQGGYLATLNWTPSSYKHHKVQIDRMLLSDNSFEREWPFMWSFVIHAPENNSSLGGVVTKTTDYDITDEDQVILVNTTTTTVEITLPVPNSGINVFIKKISSDVNQVDVLPNIAETIEGEAILSLLSEGDSIHLVADGTNWHIV